MASPQLERFDHIHVHVSDRAAAERWYAETLGLRRMTKLESWATPDGPLMIANTAGTVQLAVFQRPVAPSRSIVAMRARAGDFLEWRDRLSAIEGGDPIEVVDHGLAWSMYFADPDGNPFEITSYEYDEIARGLAS